MTIRLIALDIDGTTLRHDGSLSPRNREALERAAALGIHIVLATGRCHDALPGVLTSLPGIRYALTSNGAQTRDLVTGETLAGSYLHPESADAAAGLLDRYPDLMVEIFTGGRAYMDKAQYEGVVSGAIGYRSMAYVRDTRNPVENLLAHMRDFREAIENVNIFFPTASDKLWLKPHLDALPRVTVTSSFDNNWEIGGADTSKGAALERLAVTLGVSRAEILACGDSPNDEAMLRAAGIPVAVGNAKASVIELAAFVAPPSEEDGVAAALEKFVI
jgi:Cof subfamily protein (haloacid dehalogenase superfamily)